MLTDDKAQNFTGDLVEAVEALLIAMDRFYGLRREWDAADYGNAMTNQQIVGAFPHIEVSDMGAAFSSIDALNAVLAAGHALNLINLKR